MAVGHLQLEFPTHCNLNVLTGLGHLDVAILGAVPLPPMSWRFALGDEDKMSCIVSGAVRD